MAPRAPALTWTPAFKLAHPLAPALALLVKVPSEETSPSTAACPSMFIFKSASAYQGKTILARDHLQPW